MDPAFLGGLGGGILWTPAQISTALWLDAADSSTITTVSGAVSQWNDKSGNGHHATQGTASFRPVVTSSGLASKAVITFDGFDDFMDVVTPVFQGSSNFVLLWVYARVGAGSGSDAYRPAISLLSPTLQDRGTLHYIKNTNNRPASYPFFGATPSWVNYDLTSGATYSNNEANLLSFSTNESSWVVFRNGTQEGTNVRGGSPGGDVTGLRLAQQATPRRTSNIYIAEIVMTLNSNTFNHQQLEGYLAHKWGLTANLPNDHPFKVSPPYV